MNRRLVGLGFFCFTFIVCVTPSFAGDVSTDDANHAKSPLGEPNDPSLASAIDRMKLRLTVGQVTDRILVSLKIIEFEPDKLTKINSLQPAWQPYPWGYWGNGGDCRLTERIMGCGLWEADDIRQLTTRPEVISWSSPPLNLIAGRESRYTFGGSIPVQRRTEDGVPHSSNEAYGRSIVATATISNLNRIHLAIASEVSDLTTSNGIASTGNKRRIDATFEMNHGETRCFGRKVVSTTGRETYQLIQATAWLKPFGIPLDPETIPVSAVEELSTPEKDIAEYSAIFASRRNVALTASANHQTAPTSRPIHQAVGKSAFDRLVWRIDNKLADEVFMSVAVTEVNRDDFERNYCTSGFRSFGRWEPNFYSRFPSDVVEVETPGDPSVPHLQSTDLVQPAPGIRALRPAMKMAAMMWKMPLTLVESGKTILWQSGGEVPVVKLDQYRRESITNEQYGVTVIATPTITDLNETQVHLDIELSDLVQSTKSLGVESTRRMQATVRVRNGEVVSFGQPAVSDTGRESFLTVSVTASTVAPSHDLAETDVEITSALSPENSDAIRKITPVNANFETLFGVGSHKGCWADSIPPEFKNINHILEAFEHHRLPHPDAETTQLSYRLAHPFDESSPLFADP